MQEDDGAVVRLIEDVLYVPLPKHFLDVRTVSVKNSSESSQNPVDQRNLANEAADEEAERKRDEYDDDKFEQGVQSNRVEGIGKTYNHQGMDQVDGVGAGG